jgi:hypothetical protein
LDVDLPDNANPPKERMAELLDSINESSSQLMEAVVSTDVDELIQEYEAATTTQGAFGYAKLDKSEKTSIHQHLKKIREIIEKSALDDRKKNALFERINKLSEEVDREGTRTDRFFAFAGDLAFVAGIMAGRAKPAINEFKEILKIVLRSRARQEQTALPKPQEVFSLPDLGDQ